MIRQWLPYILIFIGGILFTLFAFRTELPRKDAIVLQAMACTCPDYRVVQGSWKLSSPLLDTIAHLDMSEVYVTGSQNAWCCNDPSIMYDLMLAEGEVVGVDRVYEGAPWNPVIHVTRWEHLGLGVTLGYGVLKWGTILLTALGLWMLVAKRIGY